MPTRGEVSTVLLFGVGDVSQSIVPVIDESLELSECCYILPLLAHLTDDDPLKNDRTSYFNYYDQNAVTAVDLIIQKCEGGTFTDKHTVVNNLYGQFSPLGDEVHNIDGVDYNYIRLDQIDWTAILATFGEGEYRIKAEATNIFASSGVQESFDFVYELKNFTTKRANATTFFTIYNSGVLGDRNDGTKRFIFPNNYIDGKRINGTFGNDFSGYESEYTAYNDGFEQFVTKKRIPKFIFLGDRLSEPIRKYFENEMMMADKLLATGYINNAANTHINTPVQADGEYKPTYYKQSKKAAFEVEFKHAYQDNYEKKHC